MTLAETLLRQLDDPTLSHDERAQFRCRIAADLEHRGQYEAARDALGEFWQGVGQRPALESLNDVTAAEVLLRVGTLSGWFGSVGQIEGAQDAAKDLISESITRFQALGEAARVAAALSELGFCYRRAGAYDEARVIYNEALKLLTDTSEKELRAKILLRLVIAESCSGRYNDALRILMDATGLFEESTNDALKGRFHNELACTLVLLGKTERRPDYSDRAIIEYTAASHHFEQAGHTSYRASAENNLGFLFYLVGRYQEAHEHLNRARRLFLSVRDKGRIAQVDDARARVLLTEGRAPEAERVIRAAVRTLEKGGEQALLAEALTTQGRVLAKVGNFGESLNTLRRAADLAEAAGAFEDAGGALLSLIEEHADRITEYELLVNYQRADHLLRETQDTETMTRLRDCASRIVSTRLATIRPRHGRSLVDFWATFNLPEKVLAYEARYVRRALIAAQGSVTRAARLLGWPHHGTLQSMLEGRHKNLAHLRTPPEPRRQNIIAGGSRPRRGETNSQTVRILHAEDYAPVAAAVSETLEDEGWAVRTCVDGAAARREVEGASRYDLLIFDHDLKTGPGGLELVRLAQRLPHRRRTPIIMLSGSEVESEAWRAGVDAFLRKPQDIGSLTAMVTRLLSEKK